MGQTILLADKSVTIQKIVELTFADENYQIKSVSDGQAALDAISQIHPDLILADISLPLKNGYELCHIVRTDPAFGSDSNIPVILLAGIYETMDEDRLKIVEDKVREAGANGFLSKPFDPQLLTHKVKELMPREEAAPVESMFAKSSSAADVFAAAGQEKEETPEPGGTDDGDRTMMIPSVYSPVSNMFAEAPPVEQEEALPEPPRPPVNIDAIKPTYEPVFEMEDVAHEAPAEEEDQELERIKPSDIEASGAFTGREEQEFSSEAEAEGPTLILPSADEPFGDLYESEAPSQWSSASASEEEAPFGLPQPPALEPTPAVPVPAPEPAVSAVGTQQTEAAAEVAPQQETYEDTWPGVPVVAGSQQPPVDELFEGDAAAGSSRLSDEVEELQPDLTETGFTESQENAVPVEAPASPAASRVEITDELVERIANLVVARLSERFVSEIVWQVVPDLAEKMIRRELEKLHAGEES